MTGVKGGHGGANGVEGGTWNDSTRGTNTSLHLPHRCLVVPHAQWGGFDEAVGEDGSVGCRCLVADNGRFGEINNPYTSLLDGKGENGAEGGRDDSGGSATQEFGKKNSAEFILDGVELGGDAIDNSLKMLSLLLETFLESGEGALRGGSGNGAKALDASGPLGDFGVNKLSLFFIDPNKSSHVSCTCLNLEPKSCKSRPCSVYSLGFHH